MNHRLLSCETNVGHCVGGLWELFVGIEENISLATIQKSEEEMEREALKEAGVMFSSDEEDFNQGDSVLVRKKSSSNDH